LSRFGWLSGDFHRLVGAANFTLVGRSLTRLDQTTKLHAIDLSAFLAFELDLSFLGIFQVIDEDAASQGSYCYGVAIWTEANGVQLSLGVNVLYVLTLHNVIELDLSIHPTRADEQMVHWGKGNSTARPLVGIQIMQFDPLVAVEDSDPPRLKGASKKLALDQGKAQ